MDPRQRSDSLTDRPKKPEPPEDSPKEPRYHVYIRLPFHRPPGFVEPGTVNWNEKKSEKLWTVLSNSSIESVDWTRLAGEFEVSVEFLLQMANYLTERHTTQLRAHMLRVAAARGSAAPSPVPGADPGSPHPGAEPPRHVPSGPRAPSALSIRRDILSPTPGIDEDPRVAGAAGLAIKSPLAVRPGSSRNSLVGTPVPSHSAHAPSGVSRPGTAVRQGGDASRRRFPRLATPQDLQQQQPQQPQQQQPQSRLPEGDETEIPPPSPALSAGTSSSSSSDSPVQSRIIRRPPRFQPSKEARGGTNLYGAGDDPDDADDDDEPAFLPFAHGQPPATHHHHHHHNYRASVSMTSSQGSGQDLGATLRGGFAAGGPGLGRRPGGMPAAGSGGANAGPPVDGGQSSSSLHSHAQSHSQTSDSSIGSAAVVRRPGIPAAGGGGMAGHRRAPLAAATTTAATAAAAAAGAGQGGLARGVRGKGASREESDGTPSMGSSFSDLDDASVTQSALEEALASRMQDGTLGSRMSVLGGTIGHALRSRYLPKPHRQ
ncbi:hypothetical protein VTJ83DRAFT_1650 [Remersonia thermophila]|uniref:Autophagy-related protein 29 n=1 Tax=Remersonia thermophila TaxID=72144 RepID=A0ABR4DI10_9PEZI